MESKFVRGTLPLLACLSMLLFSQCQREEPLNASVLSTQLQQDPNILSLAEAREVASSPIAKAGRLNGDSTETRPADDNEVTDQATVADSLDGSPLLYIFQKKRGFMIVSADLRVMPILAFSETSKIDVRNIPNGVRYGLIWQRRKCGKPDALEANLTIS